MESTKRCPFCGEEILSVAIKCKHCQTMLNASVSSQVFPPKVSNDEPESILLDSAANLIRGLESVGGRILLTNKYLKFNAHLINLQSSPLEIPITDIKEITKRNTMGFVPNGILVTCKSGQEYKFVVFGRDKIVDTIRKMLY